MHFALSDEQVFLQEAAAQALGRHDTLGAARAALDGEAPPSLWTTAVDAGWPGLLVGEDVDGAGLGALEGMLVLEACGRALADARLLGHLPATFAMEAGDGADELRASLATGEQRAALVDGRAREGGAVVTAAHDGDDMRLSGVIDWVLDAPGADVLVVGVADEGDVMSVACVDASAPGVEIESHATYDATRSLGRVEFHDAPCIRLAVASELLVADAVNLQRTLLGAEALGAAAACLAMATQYAKERVTFGRPIGSYQAIKHTLVEILRRVDNARSLTYYAGWAWEHRRSEFAVAANAVRVAGADALDLAATENIFIHGAVGATWEHDASLYYRRAQLSRRLLGGTDRAADAVAGELLTANRG
jgi:alkylation response protein AidB-like acyl-CoA dehydrogenase